MCRVCVLAAHHHSDMISRLAQLASLQDAYVKAADAQAAQLRQQESASERSAGEAPWT